MPSLKRKECLFQRKKSGKRSIRSSKFFGSALKIIISIPDKKHTINVKGLYREGDPDEKDKDMDIDRLVLYGDSRNTAAFYI